MKIDINQVKVDMKSQRLNPKLFLANNNQIDIYIENSETCGVLIFASNM